MVSLRNKAFVTLMSLGLCFALTQIASAQRGGRRGGFFAVDRVRLASIEKVQAELKMTDEQKALAKEVSEKLIEERRSLFQGGGGGDRSAMREKMAKMSAEASTKIVAKLDEAQNKRLTELYVRFNGTNALMDEAVGKALSLDEEQQKKLKAAGEENQQARMSAFQGFQDLSQDERRESMEKLRKEASDRVMAVLTAEQKEAFEELKGKELEIERSELFPGFGRGGGRNRPQ